MVLQGLSLDEIADANERAEGWHPSRSAVSRRLDAIGVPPRRLHHGDLIPWRMRPEHNDHRYRHMLQAESRYRADPGKRPSPSDQRWRSLLSALLYGRGPAQVIGYDPKIGYYTTDRLETNDDIIRRPAEGGDGTDADDGSD